MKRRGGQFLMYLLRWQAAGIMLSPCVWYFQELNGWNALSATIVVDIIGAILMYPFDRIIFKEDK